MVHIVVDSKNRKWSDRDIILASTSGEIREQNKIPGMASYLVRYACLEYGGHTWERFNK